MIENIPRILPLNTSAIVNLKSWEIPEIFSWLRKIGNISNQEMLRTFNCGIGMIVIVDKNINLELDELDQKYELIHIGEIISGLDPVINVNVE